MQQHVTRKSFRHQSIKRDTRRILTRMDALTRQIHELRAELAMYHILCPKEPACEEAPGGATLDTGAGHRSHPL